MTVHKDVYYWSKALSVDIQPERGTATIRFGTRTPQWIYKRKEGEITHAFFMADEFLRSVAVQSGRSILLRFDTANSRLKKWVLHSKDHLGFDSVDPRSDQAYRITVEKTYGSNNSK